MAKQFLYLGGVTDSKELLVVALIILSLGMICPLLDYLSKRLKRDFL